MKYFIRGILQSAWLTVSTQQQVVAVVNKYLLSSYQVPNTRQALKIGQYMRPAAFLALMELKVESQCQQITML